VKLPFSFPFHEKSIGKINELEQAIYGWFQEDENNIKNEKKDNVDMISFVVKDEIAMPAVLNIPSSKGRFDEYVLDACSLGFIGHILCCFTLDGKEVVHENGSLSKKSSSTLYHAVRHDMDEALSCPIRSFPWKSIVTQGTWRNIWMPSVFELNKNNTKNQTPCDLRHNANNDSHVWGAVYGIICFYVRKNQKTSSGLDVKATNCLQKMNDFPDEQKIKVFKTESYDHVLRKQKASPNKTFISQYFDKMRKRK